MNEPLSILEKIIESEKTKQLQELDPEAEVNYLFTAPKIKKERERDVVRFRYGLNGEKPKTLEEIGKKLGITRERVRQIEKATLKKIEDFSNEEKRSQKFFHLVTTQLESVGGIATFSTLAEMILGENDRKLKQRHSLYFLLFLNKKFVQISENNDIKKSFVLDSINLDHIYKTIDEAVAILESHSKPVEERKLLQLLKEKKIRFEDNSLVSALTLSKKILKTEEGHFGLSHWRDINPKSIRDKTYYILKKHNKPLHFEDISKHVEGFHESEKKVTKQAVHNELIRDERFVLIGRGIYALSEWGYTKGVVEEVIEEVLITAGKPLHKDEIIKQVLKRRVVKETTILLNLQKNRFKRVARATYTITNQEG